MSVNCPQGKLRPCPDMNVWDCWEEWGGNRGQSEVHANKINYSFFEVIKKNHNVNGKKIKMGL